MNSWQVQFNNRLSKLEHSRHYLARTASSQRWLVTEENHLLNFVSNDYLGLSLNPELRQHALQASRKYGIGSTGAPSLSGYCYEHQTLTRDLAAWLGYEKALLFSSGYQLNVSIYKQLCDPGCHVWLDKNCHASHIDGILLTKARFTTYNSASFAEIAAKITADTSSRHIIISEGSFSMDGTCTYLPELFALKQQSPDNLLIIIDDAHGIGSLGKHGFGTSEQLGLDHRLIDLYIGTLGKAFGCHGGFVCANSQLVGYLQQTTRSQLFSTALPPLIAAAANSALNIIKTDPGYRLRSALWQNITFFRKLAQTCQLPLLDPDSNISPIQLLAFADLASVDYFYEQLLQKGIRVGRIFYPTVPKDKPRLRISLTAHHRHSDLENLCLSLRKLIDNYPHLKQGNN